MPQHSSLSLDDALERAHRQLSGIEQSLENEVVTAAKLAALDSDFQRFRRQYLDEFGDYEIMALGAQILDVELKLMELKRSDHHRH